MDYFTRVMRCYTKMQLIEMLKKRMTGKTQRQFAAELDITQAYLSELLRGIRTPGDKVLNQLGLIKGFLEDPNKAA